MVKELEELLKQNRYGEYDRDNFDRYSSKKKLNPHCPVIHIAGSNGKSSVAHFLEAIYKEAGYKVGLFLSPSLYEANDSIRFDGKNITDEELSKIYSENCKDFEKFGLTSFEILVALCYRYFEQKKPDIAIVECGMGGVLDATNLEDLDTRLSIVTSVSLEHTGYLGTTLSQIALHTAGIIKAEVPVLVGRLDDESLGILRDEAKSYNSPFTIVERFYFDHLTEEAFLFDYGSYKNLGINTDAYYQIRNASIAVEAAYELRHDFPYEEEALRKGLMVAPLPLRFERSGNIAFDGAQNPEAVEALVRCIPTLAQGRPVHVLFASFREKNIAVELPTIANAVSDITLTTFDHPLARGEDDYFLYAGDHPFEGDALAALAHLKEQFPDDILLVTGSLEFCAELKAKAKKAGLLQ